MIIITEKVIKSRKTGEFVTFLSFKIDIIILLLTMIQEGLLKELLII